MFYFFAEHFHGPPIAPLRSLDPSLKTHVIDYSIAFQENLNTKKGKHKKITNNSTNNYNSTHNQNSKSRKSNGLISRICS